MPQNFLSDSKVLNSPEPIEILKYLTQCGINSISCTTLQLLDKDHGVWPFIDLKRSSYYDIQKLATWETLFAKMDNLGLAIEIKTNPDQTDASNNPVLSKRQRRLYYKELVARFGHHLGISWHINSKRGRATDELKNDVAYIKSIDPYSHPIAVQNPLIVGDSINIDHSQTNTAKNTFLPLLEVRNFEMPILNLNDTTALYSAVKYWRDQSFKKKQPWVVYQSAVDTLMRGKLWGSLMSGGAGNAWNISEVDTMQTDLNLERFKAYEPWWKISANAKQFFIDHLPFWEMQNHDELLSDETAYCFAKKDEIYLVYLPKCQTTDLQIGDGAYTIAFYDPRAGGKLYDKQNEGWKITKPNSVELTAYNGQRNKDWVIIIAKK